MVGAGKRDTWPLCGTGDVAAPRNSTWQARRMWDQAVCHLKAGEPARTPGFHGPRPAQGFTAMPRLLRCPQLPRQQHQSWIMASHVWGHPPCHTGGLAGSAPACTQRARAPVCMQGLALGRGDGHVLRAACPIAGAGARLNRAPAWRRSLTPRSLLGFSLSCLPCQTAHTPRAARIRTRAGAPQAFAPPPPELWPFWGSAPAAVPLQQGPGFASRRVQSSRA